MYISTQDTCNVFEFPRENDDTIVRGGGGGQRVMIGIIIEVNDDNCGRSLRMIKSYLKDCWSKL